MCRMFGVLASKPVALGALLVDGARSLAVLSREHCDGWGLALRTSSDWIVEKRTDCAAECAHYARLATRAESSLAIAHVRKKTVGETKLTNTHPFRRGRYVLAHNGTLSKVSALAARTSAARLGEVEGDTDSERLFAFILTHVDRARDIEQGVSSAVAELRSLPDTGASSFLFSDGERMFAHRFGRTLYASVRVDPHGAAAALVASEPLTHDDSWSELAEGALAEVTPGAGALRLLSTAIAPQRTDQGVGSVSQ